MFATNGNMCQGQFIPIKQGVKSTKVGYAGGNTEKPAYFQVSQGWTGHAEAVQVRNILVFEMMCVVRNIFFSKISPTLTKVFIAPEVPGDFHIHITRLSSILTLYQLPL